MPAQPIDLGDRVEALRAERASEARSAFETCMTWVEGPAQKMLVHEVEAGLFERLMALGCALLAVWLTTHAPRTVPGGVRLGGGWYALRGLGRDVVRCRFGEVRWFRPLYVRVHGAGPDTLAPEDRAIGLANGRMTLSVHLLAGWLAAKVVFDDVVEVMNRFGGYAPSKRAVLGIVDQLGPHAVAYLENLPVPEGDGEILVIQADEKGASMVSSREHGKRCRPHRKARRGEAGRAARRRHRRQAPRVRRKKGDKSKNARMATVGVLYTLKRNGRGQLDGPINKRVIATFRGRRHLFTLLRRAALARGLGHKKSFFLADGAHGLWAMQRKFFPRATACVDWYHADEYLWKAGTAAHAEGSEALRRWVAGRHVELRRDDVGAVLTALQVARAGVPASGPGTKGRRERADGAIRYFTNHRERMHYGELLAMDMDIATGAVEGAVNNVVGVRLDRSMMRWSRKRADNVVALRCAIVNGEWHEVELRAAAAIATRTDPTIGRITPDRPQEPYDAPRKAA